MTEAPVPSEGEPTLAKAPTAPRLQRCLAWLDDGGTEGDGRRFALVMENTEGRALLAWELFLATRNTEASKATTTRTARSVASELFGADTVDEDGNESRERLEPTDAPWALLALPSALVHLEAYRAHLLERVDVKHRGEQRDDDPEPLSHSAAGARIAILRGIVKALWKVEAMGGDQKERLLATVASMPTDRTTPTSAKPTLELADLQLLVRDAQRQAFDPEKGETTNLALRDLAALVFLGLGLRGIEAVRLRWEDETQLGGEAAFNLRGKGNASRLAPLNTDQARALDLWRAACGSPKAGPVLRAVTNNTGVISERPLSVRSLFSAMARRAQKAGVPFRGLHTFRRWRITSELQAGESLPAVARRAGHANVQTTAGYDVSSAEDDAQGGRRIARGMFRGAEARTA
ncbi:MAG: site-specific integrase [Bacteroidota bacterium]